MATSSSLRQPLPQCQVFLSFRGRDTREKFMSHLEKALKQGGINAYMDKRERSGNELSILFERIKESRIAVVVISENFTNSRWCLDELVEIMELKDKVGLKVIPVFYCVTIDEIRGQASLFAGENGNGKWTQALTNVTKILGRKSCDVGTESELIDAVVKDVTDHLKDIYSEERKNPSLGVRGTSIKKIDEPEKSPLFGIESSIRQLKEKLNKNESDQTRILGVLGMPGLGKTTLVKKLYEDCESDFVYSTFFPNIRQHSKEYGLDWLQKTFLQRLGEEKDLEIRNVEIGREPIQSHHLEGRVFAVLDDVSDEKEIEILLRNCDGFQEGSRIIITSRDKKLIKDRVHDTYVVPRLNDREALQLFSHHAFHDHNCPAGTFLSLSRRFIDYAKGNPLALEILAAELRGRDEPDWKEILETLIKSPNKTIQSVLRTSYDDLSEEQKDVFLDVACFFRSEDEHYVRSLLDLCSSESAEAASSISDLVGKFLIHISGNRVEMHDLLCTMGKELAVQNVGRQCRVWNQKDVISVLNNKTETNNVRGIFLDMSEVKGKRSFKRTTFINMRNLLYLKFYKSHCSGECEADCKINFPDGLEFPLDKIRCLHWLRFPLESLPSDFNPKNLVDLKLPYSEIKQLWEGNVHKDTGKLKWIDLGHSRKLYSLSGLSEARNLERLNLEGCTSLAELPSSIRDMTSLIFLSLRGCTSLRSLPRGMNLESLKTLILSGCSSLGEFQLISESLQDLYLDDTAIKTLPEAIKNLQRLVLLNLKYCKKLKDLPNCLGELRSLQELILTGCSKLKRFPEIEDMKCLEILLLDETAITEMPRILNFSKLKTLSFCQSKGQSSLDTALPPLLGFSHLRDLFLSDCGLCEWPREINCLYSLQRLCLSRNDIKSLQGSISHLHHLKWLDLKHCKKLKSLPTLPPNLQSLDAHGCDSLEKVACPLGILMVTEQINSTFTFTNCDKLDQIAQDNIVSYAQRKNQLMANALKHYNGGFILETSVGTCFPGCEVPSWFDHETVGQLLQPHHPLHWCDSKLIGIALCAVVSFQGYQDHTIRFSVKCTCEFKNEDWSSPIRFSCTLGGWVGPCNEPRQIESDHVFIGYTSCLQITRRHKDDQCSDRCMPTQASLKFYITDDTSEVARCEVVKCGLSLVHVPDETDNISGQTNLSDLTPRRDDNFQGKAGSDVTLRRDDNIQCNINSNSDVTRRRDDADDVATSSKNDIHGASDCSVTPWTENTIQIDTGNEGGSPVNGAKNPGGTSEENGVNDVPNTTCFSFVRNFFMGFR